MPDLNQTVPYGNQNNPNGLNDTFNGEYEQLALTMMLMTDSKRNFVNQTLTRNKDFLAGAVSNGNIDVAAIANHIDWIDEEKLKSLLEEAKKKIDEMNSSGVKAISMFSEYYPQNFRDLGDDAPVMLYAKGNIELLKEQRFTAIVGSRNIENEDNGKRRNSLVKKIAGDGEIVVSGLSNGCDTIAHTETLSTEHGHTIAILPFGVDYIAPYNNKELADEIVDKGSLLLSEWPDSSQRKNNYKYIERDRLEAALANRTIVLENPTHGPKIHEIEVAHNMGKPIACVSPELVPSNGNQNLINNLSAVPLKDGESLNSFYALEITVPVQNRVEANAQPQRLETPSQPQPTQNNTVTTNIHTVRDAVDNGVPISLNLVAGTADSRMIEWGTARTLKEFEAHYILARALNSVNERRKEQNDNPERDNIPYVTTSHEQAIGEAFEKALQKRSNKNVILGQNSHSLKPGNTGYLEFVKILRDSLSDIERVDEFITDAAISKYVDEFENLTHAGQVANSKEELNYALPLSPFDPHYAKNRAFLEHGGHILYGSLSELDGSIVPYKETTISVGYYKKEDMAAVPPATKNPETLIFKNAGRLSNQPDRIGLTPLLTYCTSKDEIDDLTSAFISYQIDEESGESHAEFLFPKETGINKIPDVAMNKAINILETLRKNGYSFKLKKDNNNCQIKAEIENTPYSVRIMDLSSTAFYHNIERPSNSKVPEYVLSYDFIGRVSDYTTSKTYYNFSKFRKYSKYNPKNVLSIIPFREDKKTGEQLPNPDSWYKNLELLPISYLLNIPVEQVCTEKKEPSFERSEDNIKTITSWEKPVVVDAETEKKAKRGVEMLSSTYRKSTNSSVVMTRVMATNNYGITIASDEARATNNAEAYTDKYEFMQKTNKDDYFENAVSTARKNFVQRLGIDELIAKAEEVKDATPEEKEKIGMELSYDDDEKIAETQRTYWDILTGKESVLLRPGVKVEDYNRARNEYIKYQDTDSVYTLINMAYEVGFEGMTAERAIREHALDLVENEIGTFEKNIKGGESNYWSKGYKENKSFDLNNIENYEYTHSINDGKCFNPQNVLKFMDSEFASTRAKEDIFSEMLGKLDSEYDLDSFRGNEHANYQLMVRSIAYKSYGSRPLSEAIQDAEKVVPDNPEKAAVVYKKADEALKKAISNVPNCFFDQNDQNSVMIDENGIIKYEVYRIIGKNSAVSNQYGNTAQDLIEAYKASANNDEEPGWDTSLKNPDYTKNNFNFTIEKTTGYVGQIFNYDPESIENGYDVVKTNFKGNQNYAFIPDKRADIIPNKDGEHKSFPERLRVNTYESQIYDMVYSNVLNDLLERDGATPRATIGRTTSVNKVYYGQDAKHLPLNYEEMLAKQGLSKEDIQCKMKTESSVVKLSKIIHDNADKMKEYEYNKTRAERGYDNDNYHSVIADCDGKCRNIIDLDCAGYFDLQVTGNAENQGMKMFLVKGASIDSDGVITPAKNEDGTVNVNTRSILMDNPYFSNSNFNASDRIEMAINNYIDSENIAPNIGFVQMSFGGWGYDDGFVISKDFAEKFPVRIPREEGSGEEYEVSERPRVIGDKMSDMSGNKGVIANIVDRNEPEPEKHLAEAKERYTRAKEQYEKLADSIKEEFDQKTLDDVTSGERDLAEELASGLYDDVQKDKLQVLREYDAEVRRALRDINHYNTVIFLHDNPDVDVIEAPYSHTSRQNGGTAMDALKSSFDVTLRDENGNPVIKEKCAGRSNFNLLPQTADNKTHIYSDSTAKEGRKASSQLAWALNEMHAYEVMKEFYGDNETAYRDTKEYVNALGYNFDSAGNLSLGFDSNLLLGEEKYIFELPEIPLDLSKKEQKIEFKKNAKHAFQVDIERHGGFLEIPFDLSFAATDPETGEHIMTPSVREVLEKASDMLDPETGKGGWLYEKYTYVDEDGNRHIDEDKVKGKYLLPIMTARCRANTESYDGELISHDFTGYYNGLYNYALDYAISETYNTKEENRVRARNKAQNELNKLADSVAEKKFLTKNNIMKLGVMTKRRPNSATAVWSCNPYLPIDTISMSMETAHRLKLTERDPLTKQERLNGNGVILWRDPILHDGNVRYMKVEIIDGLVGVQINGSMDKSFDGDFDGDTIGLVPLRSKAANEEAERLLSVRGNILNKNAAPETMTLYNSDGTVYHDADGNEVTFEGLPLMMNDGMDIAAGESKVVNYHGNEITLAQKRKVIESQINMLKQGFSDPEKYAEYLKGMKASGANVKNAKDKSEEIMNKIRELDDMIGKTKKKYYSLKEDRDKNYRKVESLKKELKEAQEKHDDLKANEIQRNLDIRNYNLTNSQNKLVKYYSENVARLRTLEASKDKVINENSAYIKRYQLERQLELYKTRLKNIEKSITIQKYLIDDDYKASHHSDAAKIEKILETSSNAETVKLYKQAKEAEKQNNKAEANQYMIEALKAFRDDTKNKINQVETVKEKRFGDEAINNRIDYYISELSEYTAEAFEAGFGKHLISFKNINSHLESIADYMNDGAKAGGKIDKLIDYCKALGVKFVEDPAKLMDENKKIQKGFEVQPIGSEKHGTAIEASDIVKSGFTDQDRSDSQLAVIVKKQATGLSGSVSQKGMATLRRDAPEAVLEVTYAVTQAVLQVKHNPEEAKAKFMYLQDVINNLWNGDKIVKYEIDKNGNLTDHQIPLKDVDKVHGEWRAEKRIFDKPSSPTNHKVRNEYIPHNVPRDEFVETFMAFYSDKEGLGIVPNKEFVNHLADLLTIQNSNQIGGLNYIAKKGENSRLVAKGKSFMDSFAYLKGGTTKKLVNRFNEFVGTNLFGSPDEPSTFNFAPKTIRDNIEKIDELKQKEFNNGKETFSDLTTEEYEDIYSIALATGMIKEVVPSDCLKKTKGISKLSLATTAMGVNEKKQKLEEKALEKANNLNNKPARRSMAM